jgi:lysozyme
MRLSQQGLEFIKQWEKFVDHPYDDGAGYLTIGYGHLIKPGEKFGRITHQQALEILARDVAIYENLVNRLVKVPLTQAMYDALVSLAFNWRDFPSSSHLRLLNSGDYQGAARRISEHPVTGGGVYMRGLDRRRKAESALFLSQGLPGSASANPTRPPRPQTTPAAIKRQPTPAVKKRS